MQGCFGGTNGVASEPYVFTHSPHEKRARNNKKKIKTSKFAVVRIVAKNETKGKQHKNSNKKMGKREKKTEQETQHEAKFPPSRREKKKRTETAKDCVKRELLSRKNLQQTKGQNFNEQNE